MLHLNTEECRKRWPRAIFEENVLVHESAQIEESARIMKCVIIDRGALIEVGALIDKGVTIREGVIIGEGVIIRSDAEIGKHAIIGKGAIIGMKSIIERGALIEVGSIIKPFAKDVIFAIRFQFYKYTTSPRIHANGDQFITMGCYDRSRAEWEVDFWNNPSEFPDDGSPKSEDRLIAFKMACVWLDGKSKQLKKAEGLSE